MVYGSDLQTLTKDGDFALLNKSLEPYKLLSEN